MASKQDVPAFDQLFNPTLTVLRELGGSGSIREIEDGLADRLNLPAEVAELLHGDSGAETELGYRAASARTYLKNAGHVDNSIRGVWALTPKGASVEEVDPKELVREVRRAQGERKRTPLCQRT